LQNLTKWGEALLELSQFQTVAEAKKMINGTVVSVVIITNSQFSNFYGLYVIGAVL
jgi:hypothetical protein